MTTFQNSESQGTYKQESQEPNSQNKQRKESKSKLKAAARQAQNNTPSFISLDTINLEFGGKKPVVH